MNKEKIYKKFNYMFIIWIIILAIGLVRKTLQNDTFYTIKIGELILNNGIDMMDHFSFHTGLAYTYPHWLYDVFIYLIYHSFGYTGLYISSIVLLIVLILIVYRTNKKITSSYLISAFGTFLCALSISGFVTARAQLVSFILFALEIYFIESFLKNGKKRNLIGLLLVSLFLCNVHVAVWPFYYILYLPYLAEYLVALICQKVKLKKENKFVNFLKKKIVIEKNENVKYLFLTMILSLLTGLLTPIGDTPYTYLIKMMMGNSQKYVQEHQMLRWIDSPFTIIIAFETIFLAFFSKAKLRDLFMISGLVIMAVFSIRHISLLSLIGTICFTRIFSMFWSNFGFDIDKKVISFFNKMTVMIIAFFLVIIFTCLMISVHLKEEYVDHKLYPIEAVKYIKENMNIDEMRLFNDYNFGSYLLLNNIPVYIDSRADLYTKPFSGLDYDIFDDYEYIMGNYTEKFEFYKITDILIYKNNNHFCDILKNDGNYKIIYEDENFCLFKKLANISYSIKIS